MRNITRFFVTGATTISPPGRIKFSDLFNWYPLNEKVQLTLSSGAKANVSDDAEQLQDEPVGKINKPKSFFYHQCQICLVIGP